MNEYLYEGYFAGCQLSFAFRHADTASFFGNWIRETDACSKLIRVPFSDVSDWRERWERRDNAFTEFGLSVFRASDALLPHGGCVFHGAAFLWHGKAFLLTAASGVGKSTQLRNLLTLYPDEIRVMNGDKPIFKREEDGVYVCPSPWKGKEKLGDDSLSAPLAGIVYLSQDSENRIRRLSLHESVAPLLSRFLCTFETKETVEQACSMETAILRSVPVWQLNNLGDLASSRLLSETLLQEVVSHEI